ncbi:hypothetical protein TNCV_4372701 [Trichonephila clavipes]|nr:hypothetical protein TNCV_4372701 [Trichonephila clavipes]
MTEFSVLTAWRVNVHRSPTWRVFSGSGLELVTSQLRSDTLTTRLPRPPPYVSKIEHMAFLARYVMIENQVVRVEESFIDFLETKNKTMEIISDMIESKFKTGGLDIMNCRGPANDNATMLA